MRFGVYAPTSNEYTVPVLVELARAAEAAGWEGFFIWDNLMMTFDGTGVLADTTVALTAIALATRRVRFGPLVTPLARRRPWKLARETVTLDLLSDGRLTLGVALGGIGDLYPVGEDTDDIRRAGMLDEALDVLTALWTGAPVHSAGRHFQLAHAQIAPGSLQRPRIPIWVGGYWPGTRAFRRAARWDGVAPVRKGQPFQGLTPDEVRACLAYVHDHRTSDVPLDVVYFQTESTGSRYSVEEYEHAGVTWWLESTFPLSESLKSFRDRVQAGPSGIATLTT